MLLPASVTAHWCLPRTLCLRMPAMASRSGSQVNVTSLTGAWDHSSQGSPRPFTPSPSLSHHLLHHFISLSPLSVCGSSLFLSHFASFYVFPSESNVHKHRNCVCLFLTHGTPLGTLSKFNGPLITESHDSILGFGKHGPTLCHQLLEHLMLTYFYLF